MSRTTEQWEELLDGTADGPWEAREDHGGMNLFAGSERVFGSDSCGDVSGAEEDVRLAAHAPAAVAEVVRLRREIIAMRDRLRNTARVFTHKDLGRCNPHDDMATDLTRILEGDTDE